MLIGFVGVGVFLADCQFDRTGGICLQPIIALTPRLISLKMGKNEITITRLPLFSNIPKLAKIELLTVEKDDHICDWIQCSDSIGNSSITSFFVYFYNI